MRWIMAFLLKDPLRKLIALALTIVLYAVLNEGKQQQKDVVNIPLTIESSSDVFLPDNSRIQSFRLTVRGSESRIKKLNVQDVSGKVTISRKTPGFDSGAVTLQISPDDFVTPRGIEVISIDPEVLTLPVQRRIRKEIAVSPLVTGQPRQGFECGEIRCYPDSVVVSGPEKAVAGILEISTEPLHIISGETRSFSKSVQLVNPMPEELTFNISSTNVSVTIRQLPYVAREIPGIPVQWQRPLKEQLKITPELEKVTVTLAGTQNELDNISLGDLMVYADLSDPRYAVPGEYLVPVQAVLKRADGNVRIQSLSPEKIRIKCTLN